ncbi:MAG: nucleotidyltransferase domain-containing protein [Selenomonadaceae bacterium]|nr:nucleotidyltransferase domain-containing protein [Selenomonadaceae bacterium]
MINKKRYSLEKSIENEIIELAKRYNFKKVILFGSRARGDNNDRSDIDLAISGGDFVNFSLDVEEKIFTLLKFDIVNLDKENKIDFLNEIERDGIVLYEKN